jgi:hypothetical protein
MDGQHQLLSFTKMGKKNAVHVGTEKEPAQTAQSSDGVRSSHVDELCDATFLGDCLEENVIVRRHSHDRVHRVVNCRGGSGIKPAPFRNCSANENILRQRVYGIFHLRMGPPLSSVESTMRNGIQNLVHS